MSASAQSWRGSPRTWTAGRRSRRRRHTGSRAGCSSRGPGLSLGSRCGGAAALLVASQAVHPAQVGLAQREREVDPEVDDVDQLAAAQGVGALADALQGQVGGEALLV